MTSSKTHKTHETHAELDSVHEIHKQTKSFFVAVRCLFVDGQELTFFLFWASTCVTVVSFVNRNEQRISWLGAC